MFIIINNQSGFAFEELDKKYNEISFTCFESDAKKFKSKSSAQYWVNKINGLYGHEKVSMKKI